MGPLDCTQGLLCPIFAGLGHIQAILFAFC